MAKSMHFHPYCSNSRVNFLYTPRELKQRLRFVLRKILFIHDIDQSGTNKFPIYGKVALTSFLSAPNACNLEDGCTNHKSGVKAY